MTECRPRIVQLVRAANGSSQPWFCLLDDDTTWLVKFAGAGPGPEALLAELIANSLGRLWNLPVPEPMPVLLDSSVPRAGTDEFWDVLAASQGWNLALRVIPDAVDLTPTTSLPRSTLESMLAFDTLLANYDRTEQSRNLLRGDSGTIWWIDHGSCRFLQQLQRRTPLSLPAAHFLAGETDHLRPHRLPGLSESSIAGVVATAPHQWLEASGHDRAQLGVELAGYLRHAPYGAP